MGLDCSHNAFHGAYSAFNTFRSEVCHAVGGSHPPHWLRNYNGELARDENGQVIRDLSLDENRWYVPDAFTQAENPGMYEFLSHSDCGGEISPEMCKMVGDELELLLDEMPDESGGHILARGGFRQVLQYFIDGCRAAHAEGVPLLFR